MILLATDSKSCEPSRFLVTGILRKCVWPVCIAGVLFSTSRAQDSNDSVRSELARRNNDLVNQGFNFTQGFQLNAASSQRTFVELLIPPFEGTHEVRFWGTAIGGETSFRFTSTDNQILALWQGQSGETNVTISLPPGRNKVEIDIGHATSVTALLGVKGPVLSRCHLNPNRVSAHEANVAAGFQSPYLLFIPELIRNRILLGIPNNTGFATTDPDLLAANGECIIEEWAGLGNRLGIPLLVPLFPRPAVAGEEENLYLHALSRSSLLSAQPAYRRVDLQFEAMIDDANDVLAKRNIRISKRVLLMGFSASGMFVSRFSMLHPNRVLAVAAGSPGGWPIVPEIQDKGESLPYPLGISDLRALVGHSIDLPALRRIAWYYYMGAEDRNDSVIFRDSFSKADEQIIFSHFGSEPKQRWGHAESAYKRNGLDAQFKLYPAVGHQISLEMRADVEAFFASTLRHSGAH